MELKKKGRKFKGVVREGREARVSRLGKKIGVCASRCGKRRGNQKMREKTKRKQTFANLERMKKGQKKFRQFPQKKKSPRGTATRGEGPRTGQKGERGEKREIVTDDKRPRAEEGINRLWEKKKPKRGKAVNIADPVRTGRKKRLTRLEGWSRHRQPKACNKEKKELQGGATRAICPSKKPTHREEKEKKRELEDLLEKRNSVGQVPADGLERGGTNTYYMW